MRWASLDKYSRYLSQRRSKQSSRLLKSALELIQMAPTLHQLPFYIIFVIFSVIFLSVKQQHSTAKGLKRLKQTHSPPTCVSPAIFCNYRIDTLLWRPQTQKWLPSCRRWGALLDRMAVWSLTSVCSRLLLALWSRLTIFPTTGPLPRRDMRDFTNYLTNCKFILFAKAGLSAGVYWNVPASGFNELDPKKLNWIK